MESDVLGQHIMAEVRRQTGQNIVVAATDERVILSGVVPSRHLYDHAATIAAAMADGRIVENELEVENTLPAGVTAFPSADRDSAGRSADTTQNEIVSDNDPDSMSQPLDSNPDDIPNDSVYDDMSDPEPEPVYFPPTDPVLTVDMQGNYEVLNGFASTADDDQRIDQSTLDGAPGDEALADAVATELHRDATTTDLQIDVTVQDGIAYLHGTVPDPEDAANAEDVAGRVAGIREVVEDLDIAQM
jgi:osmotically-inducible protein OsmY